MRLVFPAWITDDLPGIGGTFKATPDDFLVEEVPAYEPSGQGEFLYLWVEKQLVSARELQEQLAHQLGVPTSEVGVAGLKDRMAITRQWVSLPRKCEPRLSQFQHSAIRVLNTAVHGNKLKTGHLKGNRFQIRIRGTQEGARERLPALLERLQKCGVPNAYDRQRFGRGWETWTTGWNLLKGQGVKGIKPWLRRLALSAVQSGLFNAYLDQRMRQGWLHRVIPGEVLAKSPVGGMFLAPTEPELLETENARMAAKEIVGTGPIYGWKMMQPKGDALERETQILAEYQLVLGDFLRERKLMEGSRRRLVIYPEIEVLGWEGQDLTLSFFLPSGSYATRVIGELSHSEDSEKSPAGGDGCDDDAEFPDA